VTVSAPRFFTMPDTPDFIVILTNTASLEEAKQISYRLITDKLAACVNIFKNECSLYEWQGKVCEESEFQLVIKTQNSLYSHVETVIRELHSYEVPEIIALAVENGSSDYLEWIKKSTT